MSIKISSNCLFEIGCEELPTASLVLLSNSLANLINLNLKSNELDFEEVTSFVTPRRIAVFIKNLGFQQQSRMIEQLGPGFDQAYDSEGNPMPSCLGFAQSCGVSHDQLQVKQTPKGKRLVFSREMPGKRTIEILPEIIKKVLSELPIAKPMRWNNHSFTFVRPVHWLLFLYGEEVVHCELLGQKAEANTYGHRFLHPQKIFLQNPQNYSELLEKQGYVIPNFEKRKKRILDLITQCLKRDEEAVIEEELLNEVTSLVEWPVALRGSFKSEFLQVPQEVLIASMQTHQKCFAIVNSNQELQSSFILISNLISKNPSTVICGNERVINARLADAAFFYNNDRKTSLKDLSAKLHHVIFQQQLGSLAEKTQRIVALTKDITEKSGGNIMIAGEAAALAKCDLLTEMVGEFPNLQGTMGYYYAKAEELSEDCATAIKQHYWPRFSGDELPKSLEGAAVALADRIDTLVGILGINQAPTGDKDPFALKRAGFGICRLLIEKSLPLDLKQLLTNAVDQYNKTINLPNVNVVEEVLQFIMMRLKSWYLEKNIPVDVFQSVAATQTTVLIDFDERIRAVMAFKKLEASHSLAAANKRVSNILKKQLEIIPTEIQKELLSESAEIKLDQLLEQKEKDIQILCIQHQYEKALMNLASLKSAVDNFFDQVMVMVEEPELRLNRLALLFKLRNLFTQVADIALLQ